MKNGTLAILAAVTVLILAVPSRGGVPLPVAAETPATLAGHTGRVQSVAFTAPLVAQQLDARRQIQFHLDFDLSHPWPPSLG